MYVTLHRPSNVDHQAALTAIMGELKRLASRMSVVFPIHPRTRKMCEQFGIALDQQPGLKSWNQSVTLIRFVLLRTRAWC